jgi:hypothetical protein
VGACCCSPWLCSYAAFFVGGPIFLTDRFFRRVVFFCKRKEEDEEEEDDGFVTKSGQD